MTRLGMTGDQWADNWDGDDYVPETITVETDEREDTHFQVLGLDGNPIPKPSIRFGFHPRARQ